ncbi:hypothetical protein AA106555_0431 [Neokomagataea thailandica NBRC 106555]|uniref:Transposase n=1 Tax=Neokomagataea thailandica NBRC 106555 TaxID=1223520 RepID=A0ABQ0QN41_9PROT|nr:hypothetical protein AA106555_0431 [Neokomagataea thailandica NBRC 106555]
MLLTPRGSGSGSGNSRLGRDRIWPPHMFVLAVNDPIRCTDMPCPYRKRKNNG